MNSAIAHSDNSNAEELFRDARHHVYVQVDRLFAGLMFLQWIAGIVAALVISPRVWAGSTSQINPHLLAAIFLGAGISAVPIYLVLNRPGETINRYVIAVAQCLTSSLLIDLTGGRIETHFHVFVSLAFLALYRDWKVLIPATVVVAADHFLRGIYFPQSIYGVLAPSPWRWLEHAGWVLFEDVILVAACIKSTAEMREIAERTAQLRQSEERTRKIIATSLDAVVLMDAHGMILDWNPRAEEVFGWPSTEAIGRPIAPILFPPGSNTVDHDSFWRFLRSDHSRVLSLRMEMMAIDRAGKNFHVEMAMGAMRLGEHQVFSAFIRDIGDRKQNEDEMRTAKDAAEAASRAKSAFIANMSHEIRSPMTAILGYTDLLLDDSRTREEKKSHVQVIRRNGMHLLQLINDILDISKIEAGKLCVEKVDCDLPQLAAEIASMIRPKILEKGLDFRLVCDGEIPRTIRTDPLRLKQILANLLGNAVKFTLRGMITLRISCQMHEDGSTILFDIADTGVGMTDEQMKRIFNPFTQADETTTRRFGGTGLGLTISKRLAKMLGGDITAESTSMLGSIFHATIDGGDLRGVPMVADAGESFATPADDEESESGLKLRLTGRILLAEDGQDNQLLISLLLRDAGAEVTVADNGRMAVNLATSQPFDLILMDMQMPELDGYAAAGELRDLGMTIPIIALTAHAMAGDREKCIQAGCTDYLTKPIEHDSMMRMCDKYLRQYRGEPSAADTRAGFSKAAMDDAVVSFVERLPDRVEELSRLAHAGDIEKLSQLLHQIKGAGAGYGFPGISDSASNVERQIDAHAALQDIQRSVDELTDVIRTAKGFASDKESYAATRAHH